MERNFTQHTEGTFTVYEWPDGTVFRTAQCGNMHITAGWNAIKKAGEAWIMHMHTARVMDRVEVGSSADVQRRARELYAKAARMNQS